MAAHTFSPDHTVFVLTLKHAHSAVGVQRPELTNIKHNDFALFPLSGLSLVVSTLTLLPLSFTLHLGRLASSSKGLIESKDIQEER